MHIIKDENGNVMPHNHAHTHEHTHEYTHTHEHEHDHEHDHDHAHSHDHSHDHVHSHDHSHDHAHSHSHGCDHTHTCNSECAGDCKNETVALLTYMLDHNQHHAAELDQMADNLCKLGMESAAKQIKDAVADFEKGNLRLSLALTTVKEQLKEA